MNKDIFYIKDFSKSLKVFLSTKFFFYTQTAFSQFLINIYFWRITHNIGFLVEYNVISDFILALSYLPFGKIAKEKNRFLPFRIGIILQLVYLFLILYLKGSVINFVIPISILFGLAQGGYWLSDDLLKLELTDPENRLRFNSAINILENIAKSIIPLFASILVVSDGDIFHSYSRIFYLAIIFSLFVFISSFYISDKNTFKTNKFNFLRACKDLLRDRNTRIASFSNMMGYVGDNFSILMGLLLFSRTHTEISFGLFQCLSVLAVLITQYLSGKFFDRRNYKFMLLFGGITDFLLILTLVLTHSYFALILYGFLHALISFTHSPQYLLTLDAFNMHCKSEEDYLKKRVEYVVLQQIFLNIGRIAGTLLILIISNTINPVFIGLVMVVFAASNLTSNLMAISIKQKSYVSIDDLN